jgi:RNA polymerase sigma-70 factor, ECF subfamily
MVLVQVATSQPPVRAPAQWMYNKLVNYQKAGIREEGTSVPEGRSLSAEDLARLSDETLAALVTRRDEAALGAIYDRYGSLVYAIALRVTGDRQTAEEVVQDVFQSVWATTATYRPDLGRFAPWISGVARHRAIDAVRSKRERARTREQTIEEMVLFDPQGGPEDEASQAALREAVRSALNELPQSQRQAVELAYYGGLTRAEIAERLGEPVGTVKTRLRLGLVKLRDLLRPFAEDD